MMRRVIVGAIRLYQDGLAAVLAEWLVMDWAD
jgi:hypothetical protein